MKETKDVYREHGSLLSQAQSAGQCSKIRSMLPLPGCPGQWPLELATSSGKRMTNSFAERPEAKLAPSYHFPTYPNSYCHVTASTSSSQCMLLLQEGLFAICEPGVCGLLPKAAAGWNIVSFPASSSNLAFKTINGRDNNSCSNVFFPSNPKLNCCQCALPPTPKKVLMGLKLEKLPLVHFICSSHLIIGRLASVRACRREAPS